MKLSKNAVRILLLAGIALVCFNVIAFVLPVPKNGTFWVSYVFGMLAILLQLAVIKVAFKGTESIKSRFYGFPIARVGVVYLICQILLSFTAMALAAFVPFWIPMVIFILMLGAAAAGCIAAEAVREKIERSDQKLAEDVRMMRSLQSKMSTLVSQSECGGDLQKELEAFAEDLKYSDPVSSPATEQLEDELYFLIEDLQKAVANNETASARTICKKAKGVLAERNRVCKLNKNHS